MDYKKEYEDYYIKYYKKAELLIKLYFIKRQAQDRSFSNSINELRQYFANDFIKNNAVYQNESLKPLHEMFKNRSSFYRTNEIEWILKNEIKTNFDKIDLLELPNGYNYSKFIKELSLAEIEQEISRLLSQNSDLFGLFYNLNDFSEFEIKHYGHISLENTPIFKKLQKRLHPESYAFSIEDDNSDDFEPLIDLQKPSLPIAIAMLQEVGFFELEKIKTLTPMALAKIIAILQVKDPNNKTTNRAIRGNVAVLNQKNKEDGLKYTSHLHTNKVKSLLNEIRLGNK